MVIINVCLVFAEILKFIEQQGAQSAVYEKPRSWKVSVTTFKHHFTT